MNDAIPVFGANPPMVRQIPFDRPWLWLQIGLRDLVATPRLGLAYGLILFGISFAITLGLWLANLVYLLLPAAAGFAFVAPLLAAGIYEVSRSLETKTPITLAGTLNGYRRNGAQVALLGFGLMALHLIWIRVATLLYALFFNSSSAGWESLIDQVIFSANSLPFLIVGGLIGFALAVAAFAISAVSIPMLIDRDVSVFTAIATSVIAVRVNWRPMALWAVLIAAFVGAGLATFYLGLIVVLPLIGHATWHAYRDLVV